MPEKKFYSLLCSNITITPEAVDDRLFDGNSQPCVASKQQFERSWKFLVAHNHSNPILHLNFLLGNLSSFQGMPLTKLNLYLCKLVEGTCI